MITVDLIQKLVPPNNVAKEQIEVLLKEAYTGIQNLSKMSFDKALTLEYIDEVENLFIQNQFNAEELDLPKYLQKYAECLSQFWDSYSYYFAQRSRGKLNIFINLKEVDFKLKVFHTEGECIKVLRKMEDYWMAANQVYTKYEISLIRKEYIR